MSLMKQDDDTDQAIGDGESDRQSKDTGESTSSSDIEEDNLDHRYEILLVGQLHRKKPFRTTRGPFPKNRSRANTVIAHPLLPIS